MKFFIYGRETYLNFGHLSNSVVYFYFSWANELSQGQLQIWTEHSTLIFEDLKSVEKSKNHFSIIEHLQKLYCRIYGYLYIKIIQNGLIFEPHSLS